ncbi:MAG: response regulator receiver protein [Acidobacteriaceae bacterium]|nr:response regulator receiver protein [Acidobacteriaceae bacterium]
MTKLLFVDDEPTIRLTLPRILEMHEFEVKAAANVSDALALIQSEKFDVLLSDLNIGEPSDGFTVVSAMRRIQPNAITIIITGFPAFETALEAIRGQVDDYIVKPADTEELIETIRKKLINRSPRHVPAPRLQVSEVVQNNLDSIVKQYVERLRSRPDFPVASLTDDEIRNSIPRVLQEVVRDLHERDAKTKPGTTQGAKEHGRLRCAQEFQPLHLLEEIRILRNLVYTTIQNNLLILEVSSLIPDMVRISDSLDARLREAVGEYLQEWKPEMLKKRRA